MAGSVEDAELGGRLVGDVMICFRVYMYREHSYTER